MMSTPLCPNVEKRWCGSPMGGTTIMWNWNAHTASFSQRMHYSLAGWVPIVEATPMWLYMYSHSSLAVLLNQDTFHGWRQKCPIEVFHVVFECSFSSSHYNHWLYHTHYDHWIYHTHYSTRSRLYARHDVHQLRDSVPCHVWKHEWPRPPHVLSLDMSSRLLLSHWVGGVWWLLLSSRRLSSHK